MCERLLPVASVHNRSLVIAQPMYDVVFSDVDDVVIENNCSVLFDRGGVERRLTRSSPYSSRVRSTPHPVYAV
jgi:hypothetical protein